MYNLKLYITGNTPVSNQLISELEKALSESGKDYTLDVLDVFEHFAEAYEDRVLATPMLIKTLPPPIQRIVGDLRDRERILAALEVNGG